MTHHPVGGPVLNLDLANGQRLDPELTAVTSREGPERAGLSLERRQPTIDTGDKLRRGSLNRALNAFGKKQQRSASFMACK